MWSSITSQIASRGSLEPLPAEALVAKEKRLWHSAAPPGLLETPYGRRPRKGASRPPGAFRGELAGVIQAWPANWPDSVEGSAAARFLAARAGRSSRCLSGTRSFCSGFRSTLGNEPLSSCSSTFSLHLASLAPLCSALLAPSRVPP